MIFSRLFVLMLNCFLGFASMGSMTGGSWDAQDSSFVRSSSEKFLGDLHQDMVSQHMYKLYEKYNRENCLREGNTVRSFRASQDSSDQKMAYQLNLTTLQDSENILTATFHFQLNRRTQNSWFCKRFKNPSCGSLGIHFSPSISLLLYSVSFGSEVRSFLGNVTFHPHRRGVWQMRDVTQIIKEARKKGHLMVSVELNLGQQHQRKSEDTLSFGNLPYLLLYANDHALEEPNSVAASLQRYDPFSEGGEALHPSQNLHLPNFPSESKGRKRREAPRPSEPIQDNELPEVNYWPKGFRKDELWESTWYLALKPKPKSERKEKKRKIPETERVEESRETLVHIEAERASQGLKPEDSSMKKAKGGHIMIDRQKHGHRNEEKERKKHKVNANTQSPVLSFDEQTIRKARRRQWGNTQHRGCSRRNLRVDFADIGWSEWVIAPKAFDAYYCAGTCGFPMSKVMRPSNHATIQSIVRAVGIIPGVPEPCCVPEKMTPLAVLYQDESRNPVLKVYPNMSVQSCSCR